MQVREEVGLKMGSYVVAKMCSVGRNTLRLDYSASAQRRLCSPRPRDLWQQLGLEHRVATLTLGLQQASSHGDPGSCAFLVRWRTSGA